MIGGFILGVVGPYISRYMKDSGANSFDYVIRTSAMFGGNVGLGQAMTPCVPVLGELCVPAISATTATIGIAAETLRERLQNPNAPVNDRILPWTQRAASGVMIGAALGGLIGFLIFPPTGGFIGAGIGGFVGGVIACLAEPVLRKTGFLTTSPMKTQQQLNSEQDSSGINHLNNQFASHQPMTATTTCSPNPKASVSEQPETTIPPTKVIILERKNIQTSKPKNMAYPDLFFNQKHCPRNSAVISLRSNEDTKGIAMNRGSM